MARLFEGYHRPTLYTCKLSKFLIILSDIEKADLSKNYVLNFSFVKFFPTIYSEINIL